MLQTPTAKAYMLNLRNHKRYYEPSFDELLQQSGRSLQELSLIISRSVGG